VGGEKVGRKNRFPTLQRAHQPRGICPFRETCTVYQHLLRDNYYCYPSWEAYYAQRRMCEEGRKLREEREKEQARRHR